jgi:type II secretory pathway pseudopilin PulG
LLTVIAIMAVLMGATTAAYFGLGRGARLRGAVSTLRSSIALTRQQAILKGQTLRLEFSEPSTDVYQYEVWNRTDPGDPYQVGTTGYLPRGIKISPSTVNLTFYPTGSAGAGTPVPFTLTEIGGAGAPITLTVYPLTGLMKVD